MNQAEEFVSDICNKGFLSLWSFPNPLGKKNKELCDVLVVCDPYIIIFSVKHIQIKDSGNITLDKERWHKRAILDSVKQLYGAKRHIDSVDRLLQKDKISEIILPIKSERKFFNIAVTIGRNLKFEIVQQDFGDGFVHVFDEKSVFSIIYELDTIEDFTEYLVKKEEFISNSFSAYLREENFLGYYLFNNRRLPEIGDKGFIFENDIWDKLQDDVLYKNKKDADGNSYLWDKIIEEFSNTFHIAPYTNLKSRNELEVAFRIMAKENRLSRRILSQSLIDVVQHPHTKGIFRVRIVFSESSKETAYLYLIGEQELREERKKTLEFRCFVASYLFRDRAKRIVGIATEPSVSNQVSFDFCYMEIEEWTAEGISLVKEIQEEYGYFTNSTYKTGSTKEYPE